MYCKIIYPGAKGDAWWDMDQLLKQMHDVINIFEEAYPTCQALFIFDQSSAHQSLGPNAVTLGSPGYGQGPLGPADIRSATRLPPQPLGPPGVLLGDMGVMLLIF